MPSKLREPKYVEHVCGDAPIEYADINNLRYIKAILDEGLRLHPSVPMDGKLAIASDTLPNGTVVMPGTLVQYNSYAQGRCTDLWGADAATFRPERWLERAGPPSSYEFVAFHAGPRECLGRRLAGVEMTMFMASSVRAFDFRLAVAPTEIKYDVHLTLGCSTGCAMIVTER